jgi:predicted acetyltransferase
MRRISYNIRKDTGGGYMELLRVPFEKKIVLRNLMELYQYDMSQYEEERDNDLNEYGLFDYKYIDHYWTEEGRHPFFVMVSGKLAGFVLVREITAAADSSPKFSMAEFFILRKYRRQGIGKEAAYAVFKMFKGKWSVSYLRINSTAKTFWRGIISEYSGGEYSESTYAGKPSVEFNS